MDASAETRGAVLLVGSISQTDSDVKKALVVQQRKIAPLLALFLSASFPDRDKPEGPS